MSLHGLELSRSQAPTPLLTTSTMLWWLVLVALASELLLV